MIGAKPSNGSSSNRSFGWRTSARALLRYELQSKRCDRVRRQPPRLNTIENDAAGTWLDCADQALQRRALPCAVPPKQRHHFVPLDAKGNVEQDVAVLVIAVDPVDLEQRAHAAATPPR